MIQQRKKMTKPRVKKKTNFWLNMREKSNTDLPNLAIILSYLHGNANHLSAMKSGSMMKLCPHLMCSWYLEVQKHDTNELYPFC